MTSFDRKHLWEIQAIRDVLLIAGGLSLLWLGYALSSITIPLLMALLLAYLVEPLVEGLGQRGVSRSRAAAWFVGLFGVLVVGLLALVLPLIVGQTLRLVDDVESGDMQAPGVAGGVDPAGTGRARLCKDWPCCCQVKQRSTRKAIWLRLRAKSNPQMQTLTRWRCRFNALCSKNWPVNLMMQSSNRRACVRPVWP